MCFISTFSKFDWLGLKKKKRTNDTHNDQLLRLQVTHALRLEKDGLVAMPLMSVIDLRLAN